MRLLDRALSALRMVNEVRDPLNRVGALSRIGKDGVVSCAVVVLRFHDLPTALKGILEEVSHRKGAQQPRESRRCRCELLSTPMNPAPDPSFAPQHADSAMRRRTLHRMP
jgi:hypothetical protein